MAYGGSRRNDDFRIQRCVGASISLDPVPDAALKLALHTAQALRLERCRH